MHRLDPHGMSRRVAQALAAGLTEGQLRGRGLVHPAHGLVRPARIDADPLTLQLADVLALLTRESFVGGWASLKLQGNAWFDGRGRSGTQRPVLVHCLQGSQLRTRAGLIQPFRGLVHPAEVIDLGGFEVSTMARAAFDEMRMAPNLREAVVVLDMAISTTHLMPHASMAAVANTVGCHHKMRGIVMARRALALGSSRSASPWETRTRLLAQLDADMTRLSVNVPLFDVRGRLLGVADLLDEDAGLVIESDGGAHREQEQHTIDNRREEDFERAGLVVSRITSLDHQDRWNTVERIVAAHRDAMSTRKREWTTQKPVWWHTWAAGRRWD